MEVSVKNLVNELLNDNYKSIKIRDIKQALTIYVQAFEAANKENADLLGANYQLKKKIAELEDKNADLRTDKNIAENRLRLKKESGDCEKAYRALEQVVALKNNELAKINEDVLRQEEEINRLKRKADERRKRTVVYVNGIRSECAAGKREVENNRRKIRDLDNQLTQARRWANMVSHGQMGEILKIVEDARKTIDDQKIAIDKLNALVDKQHVENENLRVQAGNQQNAACSYIRTGCVAVDIEPAIFLQRVQKMGKMQKEIEELEGVLFKERIKWERAKFEHFNNYNMTSFRDRLEAESAYNAVKHKLEEAKEALTELTNGE